MRPGHKSRTSDVVHRSKPSLELAIGRLDEDENILEGTKQSYLASGIGVTNTVPLYNELGLFKNQLRIVLRNCGFIDPKNIDEYIARGGYLALYKVPTVCPPTKS